MNNYKKLIIYGVNSLELRRKIEHFLNDDFVIIGYTDTYLNKDIVDGKNFILLEQLKEIDFDYIVISIMNESHVENVRHKLVKEYGVEEKKTVNPIFFKGSKYFHKDLVNHIKCNLNTDTKVLIFGLSYSLRGIEKSMIKKKTFDFSWHGLDLYYNYKLFLYAKSAHLIGNVEYSFLVFPYYYFNYDMSCSGSQYNTGQIISVSGLNDKHNRDKMEKRCYDYEACEEMFASKFLEWYSPSENIYNYSVRNNTKQKLSPIWGGKHDKTIHENQVIYNEFVNELLEISKHVILLIPPFYIDGIDEINEIESMKSIFLNIIKYRREEIDKIDLFDDKKYQQNQLFADETHLNYMGAKIFTEEINSIID